MAPELEKAANILIEEDDQDYGIIKVNCDAPEESLKNLCKDYGVQGYPTLKMFQ